jgi:hypothetical protein
VSLNINYSEARPTKFAFATLGPKAVMHGHGSAQLHWSRTKIESALVRTDYGDYLFRTTLPREAVATRIAEVVAKSNPPWPKIAALRTLMLGRS